MPDLTPAQLGLLAAIVKASRGAYALESDLVAAGVSRESLGDLAWAGLADCLESTGDGDYLPTGTLWTLTPYGSERAGVILWEWEAGPVWESREVVLDFIVTGKRAPTAASPLEPGQRRVDVNLGWVARMAWNRAEERREAAERAKGRLEAELAKHIWGGKGKSTKKHGRPRRRATA